MQAYVATVKTTVNNWNAAVNINSVSPTLKWMYKKAVAKKEVGK